MFILGVKREEFMELSRGTLIVRRALLLIVLVILLSHHQSCVVAVDPTNICVCYGQIADNLPSPKDVVDLYTRSGIRTMRLFDTNPDVLNALRGSSISVHVGIKNQDIASIAASPEAANAWVQANIVPFNDVSFGYIFVGNEVIPGPDAQYVAQAINNTFYAVHSIGRNIGVSTVVSGLALASSYPPSSGAFSDEVLNVMKDVTMFLWHTGGGLYVNVYPYFAYASQPAQIRLDYALFNSKEAVVVDGSYSYFNLFDAMIDAWNAALEKIGMSDLFVEVSETGWPSAGNEPYTSKDNARTYNMNLKNHVLSGGTPRRPDHKMDTCMFAMFNEDQKPAGVEQNFGFFYPNMEPVYPFW